MPETTYQVILSSDGKHTVIATSNDVTVAKAALAWAEATYDAIIARYGLKHEQYQRNGNGKAEDVPVCAVHHRPMVKQEGKYGPFWSCHQRSADGSFCDYRPNDKQVVD